MNETEKKQCPNCGLWADFAKDEISPMEKISRIVDEFRFDLETEHSMRVTAEAENERLKEEIEKLRGVIARKSPI